MIIVARGGGNAALQNFLPRQIPMVPLLPAAAMAADVEVAEEGGGRRGADG